MHKRRKSFNGYLTIPALDLATLIEDELRYFAVDPLGSQLKAVLLLDRQSGHFSLLHVGWENGKYINDPVAHLELQGDHIFVHDENAGMNFVAPNLIKQGVPRDKIKIVAHPDHYIEEA